MYGLTFGDGQHASTKVYPGYESAYLCGDNSKYHVTWSVSRPVELLWYKHTGQQDGTANWASEEGKLVGSGWSFPRVFAGPDGVIYGTG